MKVLGSAVSVIAAVMGLLSVFGSVSSYAATCGTVQNGPERCTRPGTSCGYCVWGVKECGVFAEPCLPELDQLCVEDKNATSCCTNTGNVKCTGQYKTAPCTCILVVCITDALEARYNPCPGNKATAKGVGC
jgi:hypothetical protein